MSITSDGGGVITLDDATALNAPPPPSPRVPKAPDPADVAHIDQILLRNGLDRFRSPPAPEMQGPPDPGMYGPPEPPMPGIDALQRIAEGVINPDANVPTIAMDQNQPIDMRTGQPLGPGNLPPAPGELDTRSLELLPPADAELLGLPSSRLAPLSVAGPDTVTRGVEAEQALEAGINKSGDYITEALQHAHGLPGATPGGAGAGGMGPSVEEQVQQLPEPVQGPINAAISFTGHAAPYAALATVGEGAGIPAGVINAAFAVQGGEQAVPIAAQWQQGEISGKQALIGILESAGPAFVPYLGKLLPHAPKALVRLAKDEGGGGAPLNPGGERVVPGDAAAKSRLAEIAKMIPYVDKELESAVGQERRVALAEQMHQLEQEKAQLENRPLPGQSDMFDNVVAQAPESVHEQAAQGDLFAGGSPPSERARAAGDAAAPAPSSGAGAPVEHVTPADVAKIEAYHAEKGTPSPADNVQTIPLSRVTARPDLFQARDTDAGASHAQAQVDKLKRLQDQGVPIGPPTVVKDPATGDYITVIGHHRTELARQGGATEIPMKVDPGDINNPKDLARLRQGAVTSNYKTGTSFSEDARAYDSLQKQGHEPTEIRALTKAKSVGAVEDTLDAARLGNQALERMNLDKTAQGIGAELGRGVRAYGFSTEDANAMFNKFLNPDEGGKVLSRTAVRATVDVVGQAMKRGDAAQFDGFAGMGAESNAMKLLNDFAQKKQEVETAIRDAKSLQTKLGRRQKDAEATPRERTNATRAASDAKSRQGRLEGQLRQLERGVKAEITGDKVRGTKTLQASRRVQAAIKQAETERAAGGAGPFQLKGMKDPAIAAARAGDRGALDTARGLMGEARPELEGMLTRWDTPELIAGRERQRVELAKDTHLQIDKSTGDYINDNPARKAERQRLVDDEMAKDQATLSDGETQVPIKQGNDAWLVLGPPAAGKSSIIVDGLAREHGTRVIDSDTWKGPIAQAEGLTKNVEEGGDGFPGVVHDASDAVAEHVLDRTIEKGDNLALALVGRNADKIDGIGQRLKDAGYNVHLVDVMLPADKAAGRTGARFLEKNRLVDPHYVIHRIGSAPEETYATLKGKDWVDERHQVNNDVGFGEEPKVIERSTGVLPAPDGGGDGAFEEAQRRVPGGAQELGQPRTDALRGADGGSGSGLPIAGEGEQQGTAGAGGVGEPPAKPPTAESASAGDEGPTPPPPNVPPAAIQHYLPERQQYIAQLDRTKADLAPVVEKAKALQEKISAQRRAEKAGTVVQGDMLPASKDDLMAARAEVKAARARVVEAKRALSTADVRVQIEDVANRAQNALKERGIDPASDEGRRAIAAVTKVVSEAESTIPAVDPLLDASAWKQRLAGMEATVKGTQPGVVGMIGETQGTLRRTLDQTNAHAAEAAGNAIDAAIEKHKGALEYIGPDWAQDIAAANFDKAVVWHPEWYSGITPELQAAIDGTQAVTNPGYEIIRAFDSRAADVVPGNYLPVMWDFGGPSKLAPQTARFPSGRASLAKARGWADPFVALAHPDWPYELKPMTAGELVQRSVSTQNQYIADLAMKKLILERFGVKGDTGPISMLERTSKGLVRSSDPLLAGWWVPKDVAAMVDSMRAPANSLVRTFDSVAGRFRNTAFMLDLPGVSGRLAEAGAFKSPAIMAAELNRALNALHLGIDLYPDATIGRDAQAAADGVMQGHAGSIVNPEQGTILGAIPGLKTIDPTVGLKTIDHTVNVALGKLTGKMWQRTLTPVRNMIYEGNLITAKLRGLDITDPAVRRAAANDANTWTGASRGAVNSGRRAAESLGMASSQNTRAMFAQLATPIHLLDFGNPTEQIIAAQTIVGFATAAYGMGSLLNIAIGDGRALNPNPLDSDGYMMHIHGASIPVIPQRTVLTALAKSWKALKDKSPQELASAWTAFGYSRLSPVAHAPASLLGYGYDPNSGFKTGDLNASSRIAGAVPMPPTLSDYLQHPDDFKNPAVWIPKNLGLPSHPQSSGVARDVAARNLGYADFNDAQNHPKSPADVRNIRNDPAVQDAASNFSSPYKDASAARVAQEDQIDARLAAGQIKPSDWRDQRKLLLANYAGHLNEIKKASGLNSGSGVPIVDQQNAIFDKFTDPATGYVSDPQGMADALDQFTAQLSSQDQAVLDANTGGGQHTPQELEYRADVKKLADSGYYTIADQAIAYLNQQRGGGHWTSYADFIRALDEAAKQNKIRPQDAPIFKTVQSTISKGKDAFLARRPDLDAIAAYWYGRTPRTPQAAAAVSNRLGVKVPVAAR